MLKNKRLLMLLSILIAVGLWMYVMGSVDPVVKSTITRVQIEMQGETDLATYGRGATIDSPQGVSVTIKGKRSDVNEVRKKGIRAIIDVSKGELGKNTADIDISLPSGIYGVTVNDVSDNTATFTVR